MAVRAQTYTGIVGLFYLLVPTLAYRKIVSVKREGTGYDIVTVSPGNRQVQYTDSEGRFTFVNAFAGPDGSVDPAEPVLPEKIHIIWEE